MNKKTLIQTWVADAIKLAPNNSAVKTINDCFVFGFDWLAATTTEDTIQLIPDYYVSTPKENPRSWALELISNHFHSENDSAFSDYLYVESPVFIMGSSTNYFHFVFDVLPRLLVYIENVDPSIPLLTDNYIFASSNTFQLQWLRLLKCEKLSFIKANKDIIKCKKLFAPAVRKDCFLGQTHGARFELIKKLHLKVLDAMEGFESSSNEKHEKIFVSRSNINDGRILNATKLDNIARENGFHVAYLEKLTVAEQLNLFNKAREIYGVWGAGMSNSIACNANCKIRTINHNPHLNQGEIAAIDFTQFTSEINPFEAQKGFFSLEYKHHAELSFWGRYLKYLGHDYSVININSQDVSSKIFAQL